SASGKNSWIELTITEGRNRQIHRMMEAIGQEVSRLIRVGYGPLSIDGLARASVRPLEETELHALRVLAGLAEPLPAVPRNVARRPSSAPSRAKERPVRGAYGASRGGPRKPTNGARASAKPPAKKRSFYEGRKRPPR